MSGSNARVPLHGLGMLSLCCIEERLGIRIDTVFKQKVAPRGKLSWSQSSSFQSFFEASVQQGDMKKKFVIPKSVQRKISVRWDEGTSVQQAVYLS